ncbi:MAG: adenosylcobinamide-GDP ribazoletransferase [Paracoccaceae bacterium]
MKAGRVEELRLAFMLLSRLPARNIRGEAPALAASSWAWPLVGLVVGAIAAGACAFGLAVGLTPVMSALLALSAMVLATGGLHEDGLADVADGFGGGRDRARKLEIMRDSRIGSYGVIALVLALAFRLFGIAALVEGQSAFAALIGLAAASRAILPAALLLLPPARAEGLGHAATATDPATALVAAAIGLACLLPLGLGVALSVGFTIAVTAVLVAGIAVRQIGGQTGDVMGAMQQVTECAGWAVIVALL